MSDVEMARENKNRGTDYANLIFYLSFSSALWLDCPS